MIMLGDSLPPELAAEAAELPAASADKLDQLHDAVRYARDNARRIEDTRATLRELERAQQQLLHQALPDLFDRAHVTSVSIPAQGNQPAYKATVRPYYKANISASWDDERRARAFEFLEARGAGDLVKTHITITLGRGERETAEQLKQNLDAMGQDYDEELDVSHMTLTAWFKEQCLKGSQPPLEPIGGTIGRVMDLKEDK